MTTQQNTIEARANNLCGDGPDALRSMMSNAASVELTEESVARVLRQITSFFDCGADWADDILPTLPADGIGLVAVAAVQYAHRSIGAWNTIAAMVNFCFLSPHLRSAPGGFSEDERADLAIATLRDIIGLRVDTSDEEVRWALYESCSPKCNGSLLGYCLLQAAQAAILVDNDPSPFDWAALNIANELVARIGKDAALEFADYMRHAGTNYGAPYPVRAA